MQEYPVVEGAFLQDKGWQLLHQSRMSSSLWPRPKIKSNAFCNAMQCNFNADSIWTKLQRKNSKKTLSQLWILTHKRKKKGTTAEMDLFHKHY